MPRVPMLLLPLLLATPGCAPFVGGPVISATPSACSSLIPDSWRKPVDGAPLPFGDVVGDWIAFADAQTGKLDIASGRIADVLSIIERCEERDRAAVKRSRSKLLGIF